MTAPIATRIGYFGKLPAVGDFVRRGLPLEFLHAWDGHFQHAIGTAQQRLGEGWQGAWRDSPVWRFLLPPGTCGADAWTGVMGPSRDRVGRGFPMVMATPCRVDPPSVRQLLRGGRWYDALATLYRHAQAAPSLDADTFAEAIDRLPELVPDDTTTALGALPAHAGHCRLPLSPASAYEATLHEAWCRLQDRAGDWCLWWTTDDAAPPALLATRGLPTDYSVMLGEAAPAPVLPRATARPRPVASRDDITERPAAVDPVAPVLRMDERRMTLVCADDAAVDATGRAASAIRAAARMHAGGIDALRGGLLALHPLLRSNGDDLINPLAVDAAVVAAQWGDGQARLLRIGAAAAWHWRRGQMRAVFSTTPTRGDGGLDDLLFGPAGPVRPGLGGALPPHVDEASCALAPGDRLLLVATRTLCGLPEAWFADALSRPDSEDARRRLAGVAGLRSDPSTWPIGVIDIPA